MSKLKHIEGDLLTLAYNGDFDIVVHGCNCFNTFGSGIAKQIKIKYPSAYEADCHTIKGDIDKLGTYTTGHSDIKSFYYFLVVNAYTQFDYNIGYSTDDKFEYGAFELILKKIAHKYGKSRFGFPMIGMGLAKGDAVRILAMLEKFSENVDQVGGSVTLVRYK